MKPSLRKRPPFNIILLGDPASGKATQSKRLIKKYHLYNLDMGAETRKPIVKARYDYANTVAAGNLAPTWVVRDIFKTIIFTAPPGQGILFNGTPKMIGEAKLVSLWLRQARRTDPLVLYLSIPMSEVMRRAAKRRVYSRGKLVKRDDDSEKALRNRRRYYEKQISQVVKFFKTHYAFKRISGVGNEVDVAKRIAAAVAAHEKRHNKRYGA
jgi:adenylate kinase